MADKVDNTKGQTIKSVFFAGVSLWALQTLAPVYVYDVNIITFGAAVVLFFCLPKVTAAFLNQSAKLIEDIAARIPDNIKGTAAWSKSIKDLNDIRLKLNPFKQNHGGYFGCYKGWRPFGLGRDAIFLTLPPVTVCYGSTGSGKGIYHQHINMLGASGSKLIIDFDGTETVIMADALRKKGERVVILNLDDKYGDILGPSDRFNPLDHVCDCFEHGSITDVWSDVTDMAYNLYPDPPKDNEGQNGYFRDGSRDLIRICIIITLLTKGRNAQMSHVLSLLQNRDQLLQNCLWLCGDLKNDDGETVKIPLNESPWAARQDPQDVHNFAIAIEGLGREVADGIEDIESNSFRSFQAGAVQKLINFNPATRSAAKLQDSTFKFSEQKDEGQDVTIFIVLDNTKLKSQEKLLTLITSIAEKEWVRHPNAGRKTVTLFLNEINNWTYSGLKDAFSWIRKFGVRMVLYIQNTESFNNRYGRGASDVLISEADISLYLPSGVREPALLSHLEKALGQQSKMVKTHNGQRKGDGGLDGYSYQEEARPLMYADEIRRTQKRGILLVDNKKPIRPYFTSIAATAPFRKWQGINPLYGKAYRKWIRLRLVRYAWWWPANIIAQITRSIQSRFQSGDGV